MSILNTIVCAAAGGNTGIPDCAFEFKNIKGGFLVPNSFVLTEAQLVSPATVLAALLAAVNNDNPSLRIYPLPEVVGFTDNSEDVVLQTLGYGTAVPVRDGKYNFTFQYTRGGNCISKQLQKFNGSNYGYLGFDSAGTLIATKVGATAKGIPLDYFYAAPFKLNDGSNVAGYTYRISLDPNYINQNVAFVSMNYSDLASIQGILNIVISLAAPRAENVIKVKLTTGCNGQDLYDLYSADFADITNFIVTEANKNIAITGAGVDANLKAITITLDAADGDYNPAGPFVVNLAAISVLTGNGIVGYEGIPLTTP